MISVIKHVVLAARPPRSGPATDMVWSGDEVLMYGATRCDGADNASFRIDAWRWTSADASASG